MTHSAPKYTTSSVVQAAVAISLGSSFAFIGNWTTVSLLRNVRANLSRSIMQLCDDASACTHVNTILGGQLGIVRTPTD